MARAWYAGSPADFGVIVNGGNLAPSAITLYLYDEEDGTPQTDLLDSDGVAVTEVTAATDLDVVIWQGPDDYYADLWGTPDETPGVSSKWYRFSPSIEPLVARVAALEAGSSPTALDDLSDVSTSGATNGQAIVYNSGTSTWAPGTVGSGGANVLEGVIITDGSSSAAYPDDDFLVFRPVA